MTRILVNYLADPNLEDGYGVTPLLRAIESNSVDVVEELLKAGADPDLPDGRDRIPLAEAVIKGNRSIVTALVKKPAKFHLVESEDETTSQSQATGNQARIETIVSDLMRSPGPHEA